MSHFWEEPVYKSTASGVHNMKTFSEDLPALVIGGARKGDVVNIPPHAKMWRMHEPQPMTNYDKFCRHYPKEEQYEIIHVFKVVMAKIGLDGSRRIRLLVPEHWEHDQCLLHILSYYADSHKNQLRDNQGRLDPAIDNELISCIGEKNPCKEYGPPTDEEGNPEYDEQSHNAVTKLQELLDEVRRMNFPRPLVDQMQTQLDTLLERIIS